MLTSFFDTHIYEVSSLFMGFIVFAIPIVVREELDALRKRLPYLAFAVVGVAFVVAVTLLSPVSGEGTDVAAKSLDLGLVAYVFLAAMAAISAMVLPGISGSTLLLIFGLYVPIMGAVRATMGLDLSYLPILMVFAAGIACGMLLFVRLIRMCLERFRSQTIYAIIGMMLGSLFSITQGPLTLSEPQPAMSLDTFSIVFFLIGGAVVIEVIFNLPGMGMAILSGIQSSYTMLVQGVVLCVAITFIIINIIVDMLYILIDPRIRTV